MQSGAQLPGIVNFRSGSEKVTCLGYFKAKLKLMPILSPANHSAIANTVVPNAEYTPKNENIIIETGNSSTLLGLIDCFLL